LVVHGGIAHFLVVHGEKGNYPYFFYSEVKSSFVP
jgi:hypothetical protein